MRMPMCDVTVTEANALRLPQLRALRSHLFMEYSIQQRRRR
jgi:hypothetical protein